MVTGASMTVGTAPAPGAVRWADTQGDGSEPCLEADPCLIDTAIENANNGDEVIIKQGTYSISDIILVVPGTNVHGETGAPRPRVTSSLGSPTIGNNPPGLGTTRIAHLFIENTASGGGALAASGGVIEDVVAEATSAFAACLIDTATVRDSTCWSDGTGGTAFEASSQPGTVNLRNVTAVAEGAGSRGVVARSQNPGDPSDPPFGQVVVDGKNVIADAETDVAAVTDGVAGNSADVTLAYSNYVTESAGPSDATVTPSDSPTAHNQEAPPQFVEAATGNFHEAPGSPTIDAGTTDVLLGSFDIDGEPRVQGPAPDIGADETANPTTPPPEEPSGDTTPPETVITKSPPAKSKSKSATFEFSGSDARVLASFECKRDAANFEPCSSPKTYKVGKGKHTFQVRAVDGAGNVDPTPAAADWKVKPKKKKKK